MKTFWRHPLTVAACNILLVMAIYSAMRLFCFAVNGSMFPNVDGPHLSEMLFGGIRFDLTAVLYLSSLYIIGILLPLPAAWRENAVYRKVLAWLFMIPNALGILVNAIDIIYIRFTDRRTTCAFFSEFANDDNLWRIFGQGLLDYWYVALFGIALLVLLFFLTRKTFNISSKGMYYVRESAFFAVTIYLCVIGIRGGFGRYTRPITISNAMQYVNTPRETALVLNTPFSLMKSIENTTYVEPNYFSAEELPQHMTPIHEAHKRTWWDYNVVVIILESFSKEYVGQYTPFLDSLLDNSVTFEYSFASGRKSIDAMPSILSSIPMMIEPYIVTPYSTNSVSSIAECLKHKGYQTAFFHGAPNGSMGFQAYARSAGFDAYYGMDEYGNTDDFDGTWAIWDEPFLQFFANTMNTMPEPFMTAVFTASSHHPFKVPAQYKDSFPKGTLPIHQTIGYTDHALRRFFETASEQPWFDHTLFVITADHTNELETPEYANAKGLYEVPIAFYDPLSGQGYHMDGIISQTDIMPTVLNYIGYDETYFAFGVDVLSEEGREHPYAVCYNAPLYQIFSDSLLVQFDGEKVVAVYDYRTDKTLKKNIVKTIDPTRIAPMVDYLKAYIQQYIHRMVHDELKVER